MHTNCLPVSGNRIQNMSCWPDEALINWIACNSPSAGRALSILMQRHQQKIFRRCLFRLGNHHDAEDASQDILIRMQAKLSQFEGRSKFTTWLNTITDNYCNTFALRRARYVMHAEIEDLLETPDRDRAPDPYSLLSDAQIVDRVMSNLAVNDREIINLRFYAESSLQDISSTLSLKLSATKARLYRSVDRFQRMYAELDGSKASAESI